MAIDRKRKRDTSPGMGLPEKGNESALIGQLQSAVQSLASRISELEGQTTDQPAQTAFDPQSILRSVQDLKNTVALLTSQVAQMKWEFPVHKFAKIATVGATYLECNWYFPATSTTGPAVNVAVPPGQTVGDYTADQIITVARAKTDVMDSATTYITWVANEGGGGGGETADTEVWFIEDTYAELAEHAATDVRRLGYVRNIDEAFYWTDDLGWRAMTQHRAAAILDSNGHGAREGDTAYKDKVLYVYTDADIGGGDEGRWEPMNRISSVIDEAMETWQDLSV